MTTAAIPAPGTKRLHARVRGRVQGVGFRATTQEVARRLGLAGWVRNLHDGEVELEAAGPGERLEQLLAFLHAGPRGARVAGVEVEWRDGHAEAAALPSPFELRSTF